MTKSYNVWWRKSGDGRAPEYPLLEKDYTWEGVIDASSPQQAHQLINKMDINNTVLQNHRTPAIGDVLEGIGHQSYIFTGMHWAAVEVFHEEIIDE